jgi:hypothetical protein
MGYPDDMSESDNTSTAAELEALQQLQADASELEQIEGLLDRFNVFEAIGFVNQETMHSYFLAFLLDPRQSHDLGDLFLRGFLRSVEDSSDKTLPMDLNGTKLQACLRRRAIAVCISVDSSPLTRPLRSAATYSRISSRLSPTLISGGLGQ